MIDEFKIGDRIKIVEEQRGNAVKVGSTGTIIQIGRAPSEVSSKHTVKVKYDYIPNLEKDDTHNKTYWTVPSRMRHLRITNWREIIQ